MAVVVAEAAQTMPPARVMAVRVAAATADSASHQIRLPVQQTRVVVAAVRHRTDTGQHRRAVKALLL